MFTAVSRRRLALGAAATFTAWPRRVFAQDASTCNNVPDTPTVERPPPQVYWRSISDPELALAFRCHGMMPEFLRDDVTPLGVHYLLNHFAIPNLSADAYAVAIGGKVQTPRKISLTEIQGRQQLKQAVTMECAGTGRRSLSPRPVYVPWDKECIGTYQWIGTPLAPLLQQAGIDPSAVEVLFSGWDSGVDLGIEHVFERSLPLAEALRDEVMLAWAANGQPLLPEHGFPLRLIVPSWYGMASVKWLRAITVLDEPFQGVQQKQVYIYEKTKDDPQAKPVQRKHVNSAIMPIGYPDLMSRTAFAAPGTYTVRGRAWSGNGTVTNVDFSTDGGASWQAAQVQRTLGDPFAWVNWQASWNASAGEFVLACRATDETGQTQPLDPQAVWNLGGNGVNEIAQLPVLVQDGVGSVLSQIPCQPRLALPGADLPPVPDAHNTADS
jgi:DMSO/TMAO reductase YedYZ molybdopterin-dependent catalytic subunit